MQEQEKIVIANEIAEVLKDSYEALTELSNTNIKLLEVNKTLNRKLQNTAKTLARMTQLVIYYEETANRLSKTSPRLEVAMRDTGQQVIRDYKLELLNQD